MARAVKLSERATGVSFSLQVERGDDAVHVRSEEPPFDASVALGGPFSRAPESSGVWSVVTENGSYEAEVSSDNGAFSVEIGGERFVFEDADELGGGVGQRASAQADVKAPMPGKVVKLLVSEGATVTSGQGILLFEAMKMQNEIRSPQDGVLAELAVEEGQPVDARELLFVIRQTNT